MIELGIPGLVYGQGLTLIPFDFWFGVAFMSVAAAVLGWWWLFRLFHRHQTIKRWAGATVAVAVHAAILWILFKPPNIVVDLFSEPGDYADGTDIYGIKWKSNYSELGLVLFNDADIDYNDLDVLLRTNLGFENGGIAPGINQCTLAFDLPRTRITDATLRPTDAKDPARSIPLLTPSGGSYYRMRCARFASKSRIDARFAIVAEGGKRVEPQWAILSAHYEANFMPRNPFVLRCFKGNCGKVPEKMGDRR